MGKFVQQLALIIYSGKVQKKNQNINRLWFK